jgi:hypothetical protein
MGVQVQPLVLPHEHPLSLRLAAQAKEFQSSLINSTSISNHRSKVLNCCLLSPGLVELTIQAGEPTGYGSRTWPLRVGGAGIGDDPSIVAMLGFGDVRAPVAVRFAVPIALHGVDDAGFCDASFWSNENITGGVEPSLKSIAETAVNWLEGAIATATATGSLTKENNTCQEKWKEAERHSSQTLGVIRQYAEMRTSSSPSPSAALVLCDHIKPEWIVPALRTCFDSGNKVGIPNLDWRSLVTEVGPGIYAFDLFSPEFCDYLIDEVDSFESSKLPCRRPNTMNKLGLVVNDIGLEPIMTAIVERLIAPMCKVLYGPSEEIVSALDHHHSFVVRYRRTDTPSGGDNDGSRGLDMHHDASEATLNVCLGRDNFTSGGLRFCGHYGDANHRATQLVHSHTMGRAILHLGRHRHGADNIASGERINLIVWARNSAYRGAAAFGHVKMKGVEKETGIPDRLCLSRSNDQDYEEKMKQFNARDTHEAKKTKTQW